MTKRRSKLVQQRLALSPLCGGHSVYESIWTPTEGDLETGLLKGRVSAADLDFESTSNGFVGVLYNSRADLPFWRQTDCRERSHGSRLHSRTHKECTDFVEMSIIVTNFRVDL